MPIIKLTSEIKKDVEDLYKTGKYTFKQISKIYNVSPSTIERYLGKKGYKSKSQSELQRKYPITEDFFDKIDIEEKAYILGLLYADGYNNTRNNTVCITLKEEDVEILNKITKIIQPTKPLFYLDMSPENRGMKNTKNQYRLTIANKHISKRLVELGCGKAKTSSILFPSLEQVPNILIHHFVRGYFDGDGSLSKGKSHKVDIISTPEFLLTLQQLINRELGINITKLNWSGSYINANVCSLQIGGRLQCTRFMEWLYKDSTIYLERKRKIFDERYK